jgi:predicted transcriptional regulator
MTNAARRIHEIAEQLAPDRQQVLLEIAEDLAHPSRFFESMTPEQRSELDEAIAEAERNEGLTPTEVEARLHKIAPNRKA